MLETVTTSGGLKFSSTTTVINLGSSGDSAGPTLDPLIGWPDCSGGGATDEYSDMPDSATPKFSPIKIEAPDSIDSLVLSQNSDNFAELKPLAFDYGTASLGGLDPVLTSNKPAKDPLALSSPSAPSRYFGSSQSDVTSSGSTSPPSGITKLETLDFTPSQDAFDDLGSIVGISMGADSTVPNLDVDVAAQEWSDLDAWIETTAQNIKPLVGDGIENLLPTSNRNTISNPTMNTTHPYLLTMGQNGSSTLHTLLTQGSLQHQLNNNNNTLKVTQLQQREAPPPPYSILQTRLQHGPGQQSSQPPAGIIKVDSTYDLIKSVEVGGQPNFLSSSPTQYACDSLPHSTQNPLAHHLSGIGKIKSNKSKIRKMGSGLGGGSASSTASAASAANGDQKKVMHHCQICNRGFLNKSNIKVHLRTHTGEKPFKCEHCSKAFRQKAHLLKHMSIHKRISRD